MSKKDVGNKKPQAVKKNDSKSSKKKSKPSTRPFTIYSMDEKKRQNYLKGIIYGDYGVGKTTVAASSVEVPDMRDVLYLSVESGEMSIQNFDEIDVVEPTTFRQFSQVHKFLRKHCKYRDENTEESEQKLAEMEAYFRGATDEVEHPRHYKTVVIDSLSEVQKLSMYQLLGINLETYTLDIEPDRPEFAEWNTSTEFIRLLVRLFRNLPMHVIAVCGPRVDKDERKRRIYAPQMSKALSKEVQGFVDFVGFMVAGNSAEGQRKRRIWLEPGETYAAKNRFQNWDGEYIDNPTMRDFWEIVNS